MDFVTGLALSGMCAALSRRGAARLRLLLRAPRGRLRLRGAAGHGHPGSRSPPGPQTIWRYAPLLPVVGPRTHRPRHRAAPRWSGPTAWPPSSASGELWIKNDTANPTGSFKDRVVSVALTKARQLGFKVAACASTGNLANSVAAHAARAGMVSVVFIPRDLEVAKVVTTAVYGGHVVAVEGTYDDVNRLCAELTSEHPSWAFVNVNVRTYYAEGSKTLAFEVAEQLGWQAPDHVSCPWRRAAS